MYSCAWPYSIKTYGVGMVMKLHSFFTSLTGWLWVANYLPERQNWSFGPAHWFAENVNLRFSKTDVTSHPISSLYGLLQFEWLLDTSTGVREILVSQSFYRGSTVKYFCTVTVEVIGVLRLILFWRTVGFIRDVIYVGSQQSIGMSRTLWGIALRTSS
jgi:hypothetical protein